MLASRKLSVAAATVLLLSLPSVSTAQNSDASAIDRSAAASAEESPEDALQADLREALSMLEKKQYRLLLHDFFPAYLIYQREPVFSGREQQLRNGPLLSDEEALDLTAHCKAALTGTKVFNRNKSVVEITYTKAAIELIQPKSPAFVPVIADAPKGTPSSGSETLLTAHQTHFLSANVR